MKRIKQIVATQILKFLPDFSEQFKNYLTERLQWEKVGWVNGKIVINSYFPPIPSRALETAVSAWRSGSTGRIVPEVATIAVTNKCPYNCSYCSVPDKTVNDLSFELIRKAIHSIQDMGSYHISLTGGEPLLRHDLTDIIASVDSRSIVKLFTTGYTLTKEKAKRLQKAGLHSISISLDNIDPSIHDAGCRFKGAFDIALKAIESARHASLMVCVATVATKERFTNGELFKFLEFMNNLGVDEVAIFEPAPTGKLSLCNSALLGSEEREVLVELHKEANGNPDSGYPRVFSFPYIEGPSYMGCGAGCTRLHITALGHVMPCDFTSISFGNIKEEKIEDILKRMHRVFTKPERNCFVMNNHVEMRAMYRKCPGIVDGHLLEKNRKIIRDPQLPEFYEVLMTS